MLLKQLVQSFRHELRCNFFVRVTNVLQYLIGLCTTRKPDRPRSLKRPFQNWSYTYYTAQTAVGLRRSHVVPKASIWYVQKRASPGLERKFAKRPKRTARGPHIVTSKNERYFDVTETATKDDHRMSLYRTLSDVQGQTSQGRPCRTPLIRPVDAVAFGTSSRRTLMPYG